jgi:hypothetical protein
MDRRFLAGGWLMELEFISMVTTERTVSLDFTNDLACLSALCKDGHGFVWCNNGNCRVIRISQLKELDRTATLFVQLDGETEIKKGQPLQHKIYWDDCPELPSDLSQLIHSDEADDQ